MPDTISKFRTIRLALHPSPSGDRCRWALYATSTLRGVPAGRILASGEVSTPSGVNHEVYIWEALQRVLLSEGVPCIHD